MVSAWHVGDTCGSGIVSSTYDVQWMSVVCGMRGAGGVYEMCMCLVWDGEWMRGLGLGFTNPVGTGGVQGCTFHQKELDIRTSNYKKILVLKHFY